MSMPIFSVPIAPYTSERARLAKERAVPGMRTIMGRPSSSPVTGSPERYPTLISPPQSFWPSMAVSNSVVYTSPLFIESPAACAKP